jgi:Cu-processing system permease protein
VRGVVIVAGYALRESLRRRVLPIVVVLTAAFLGLYGLGVDKAFEEAADFSEGGAAVDAHAFTGATMLGLAMFGTLFLGAVLAIFLTVGAVRGDAERGLLQPLVVRPIGRASVLAGRYLAAASVCALYVALVYAVAVLATWAAGDWLPDRTIVPGLALAGAVAIIAALSLLGSVFLSTTANGIGVFMVFGAGLVGGLLGQIGEALPSQTLSDIAKGVSWALPFEALYQAGLNALTADTRGLTGVVVRLGPFGGAEGGGPGLLVWSAGYLAVVGAAALIAFRRKDL